ncbi:MAG: tetratricopeptide repeat protein [Bacteroidia bacterium]|nr:tetratricopeptide repeat protein [Bacteroidia bacterium]MDW8015442.1 tetratricopeptide repeat protein [Bacteroidia bacterium]
MQILRWIIALSFPLLSWCQKRPSKTSASARDTTAWLAALPYFTRGVVLFTQGLIEEATEYLSKAAEAAPHSPGIHYYLARAAYAQGDPIRMLTHAEKAYREAPNELWLALGYAAALQFNNQPHEAIEILEKQLKHHPRHPEIILRMAQAYQNLGEVEKADACYAHFQYLTGSYEEAFQSRVQLLVEKGYIYKAIQLAESSAILFPRHEMYLETAARLYEMVRDTKGMVSAVNRLFQADIANSVGWEIVMTYPELFEVEWGGEKWNELMESPSIPIEVRYMLLRRADFLEEEDFIGLLRGLLKEAPMAMGWDLYARYWAQNQHWDSAAYGWKRALELDSTQLPLYMDYLYALWQLGGGDSLLNETQRAAENFPGQARLSMWEGIAYTLMGMPETALPLFRRGWRLLSSIDTLTAAIAAYYHAMAEAALKKPSFQTRDLLLKFYPAPVGEALWEIFLLRYGIEVPSPGKVNLIPSPYNAWLHFLRLYREGKVAQARTFIESLMDTSITFPLEMWEDILTKLGQDGLGTLYRKLKHIAQQRYPLANLWDDLP